MLAIWLIALSLILPEVRVLFLSLCILNVFGVSVLLDPNESGLWLPEVRTSFLCVLNVLLLIWTRGYNPSHLAHRTLPHPPRGKSFCFFLWVSPMSFFSVSPFRVECASF